MKTKYLTYLKTFSLALSLGLAASATLPGSIRPAATSPTSGGNDRHETLVALGFKVPGVRASRRRTGGISRGTSECAGETISVTPVLPKVNQSELPDDRIEVESTVNSNPTFFVHVSETPVKEAEFALETEAGETLYEEQITLSGEPGIIGLTLPEGHSLEPDMAYHWFFAVICDTKDRSADVFVDGWVKRVEPDAELSERLDAAEERELPEVYAQAGIWTDTLSELAELRATHPQEVKFEQDWKTLLESVGLDNIADEPLLSESTKVE
jgi:hypothetical protein